MQKVWIKTGLLGIKKLLSLPLYFLQRYWQGQGKSDDNGEEHSELEIENRRRNARAGVERQARHLWNAHYEPPAMGKLLQKLTTRTRKDEEIQRAKEQRSKRNSLISELSKSEGYRLIVVPFLESIEQDGYFKLRHPEEKTEKESLDWYNGKQNGRLEVIEDFRMMVSTGLSEQASQRAREEAERMVGNAIRDNKKGE